MAKPKPLKREFDLFDKPPSPLTASRPQVTVKPQALGALKGNTLDTDDSKVSWAVSLPSSNAPIGDYYDRLQQMLEQNMTEDDSDSDEEERVSAAVPLGGRKEAGVAGQAASSPSSVGPASSVSSKRSTKSNKPKLEKALARMRSLDEQLSSLEQVRHGPGTSATKALINRYNERIRKRRKFPLLRDNQKACTMPKAKMPEVSVYGGSEQQCPQNKERRMQKEAGLKPLPCRDSL